MTRKIQVFSIWMLGLLALGCEDSWQAAERQDRLKRLNAKCNGCADLAPPKPYQITCEFVDYDDNIRHIPVKISPNSDNYPPNTIFHVTGELPTGEIKHYYSLERPKKSEGMLFIDNPTGSDHYVDFVSFDIDVKPLVHLPLTPEDQEAKDYIWMYHEKRKACPRHGI